MKLYSWDEIKQAGDCVEYMKRELGQLVVDQTGEWTRFNCPWRPGSDSGAFAVRRQGFFDHVTKEGGSIIDMVARARFDGDIWPAQEHLGEYYGLKEKIKARKARRFVCAYDYRDLSGNLIHQTVRFEPKAFCQRRPDPTHEGEWIWDLDGIEPVLYHLQDWVNSRWICVVEGEKDADNLRTIGVPATTNVGGAEKWREAYNQFFADRYVCILPDNDDVGRAHGQLVAKQLRAVAKQIKIVELPGLPLKGDVSDWIGAGGTADQLKQIIRDATPLDSTSATARQAPIVTPPEISVAKKANETSFSNYRVVDDPQPDGRTKQVKEPIQMNDLVIEIHRRFWDFPRRVGSKMFDHDRQTGEIRIINTAQELFSWIAEKSGHEVNWARFEGCVPQEQLFHSLYWNSQRYEMISGIPNWPARDDVYYVHPNLPEPTPDAKYFNEFCSFFNFATQEDADLFRVCVASPLYYEPKVDRPMWVIDSTTGQESGKTKLVELLAYLYGGEDHESGEPLWIEQKQINSDNNFGTILKRLLSTDGRKKRIFLLDNLEGYFRSSSLATLITQGSISGMAPYGHGEETRPNDLTYFITVNSASLNRDLISRAFFIFLEKPQVYDSTWESKIQQFIRSHRLQVIADIIGLLEKGPQFTFTPATRFKIWERKIFSTMIGGADAYERAFKTNAGRKSEADGEKEEAEQIAAVIRENLAEMGFDPETTCAWLTSPVLVAWAKKAVPDYAKMGDRSIIHVVRNLVKQGQILSLSSKISQYPTFRHPSRSRGMFWNIDQSEMDDNPPIFTLASDGTIHYSRTNTDGQ
jgi:hypothetical protein